MAETNQEFYQLKNVIKSAMWRWKLPQRMFPQWLHIGIDGLRELHLHHAQDVKTEEFRMTQYKSIVLPNDYVDWNVVALLVVDGTGKTRLKTLGVNDEMPKTRPNCDETDSPIINSSVESFPNGIDFGSYGGYNMFNFHGNNLFSYGGGLPYSNHFQVIEEKNEMQFYNIEAGTIYLSYISDGFDPNKETILHPYLVDYARKYCLYEYEIVRKGSTETSIARTGRGMELARTIVRGTKNGLDPKTCLNLQRKYWRLTVKA